ncbi:hypothetical protein [Roseibium marinum]|uniref:DUF2946 domain-containing protein n=1 Tax=Roseibium marinum TaxID=281252 RepID=A0A2S3V4J1_9HYPH|nr:hypothetical protein [Roseibium marinum]POF34835.1 hypothetical protein CLV41_1011295 [Roseibium marinum]
MTARITPMQVFRKERHPLVTLTALAFAVRLGFFVLASALSPDAAVAAGLTSLCNSSSQQQIPPGAHDPATCQCGPVCAHGCFLQPGLAGSALAPALSGPAAGSGQAIVARRGIRPLFRQVTAIRGPPLSLI